MKLKNIAKASLALGILTTGMITTTAQPVKAESMDSSIVGLTNTDKELKDYYSKEYFNYKKFDGYIDNNELNVITGVQLTTVKLLGSDKQRIKDVENGLYDVFVVREGSGRQATNYSIGGVTKANISNYIDNVKSVNLNIKTQTGNNLMTESSKFFSIEKEEISLKELDFKLRKKLMNENGLYTTKRGSGAIVVKMVDGGFYTFELNKKLQEHRMGDVIDGTKIKEINVELN
ncbi:TPA: superantigen-like protein [Staphylococcus aureus]|uniref:exotoxin beta-grasp domain-containing protein n=1 Tax=Staphylococcus aureus TaxID=1280 RepID=UPI000F5E7B8E|nr:superantigen-like protein [Staphylococcus aureus]MCJ8108930.1 superantigen-like protein [Staphylococcus aureus]QHK49153.1 superantigen-like protein [Staphylococcus aureus]RQX55852.1 superantigen-like protein [Staphylococcus aureus]HBC4295148.1 superantigen-like protein [Staphylococcus aureus]HCV3555723.1 superantigen-like protein [Staphylococcus aureus]